MKQGLLDFGAVDAEAVKPYFFVQEDFMANEWHVCHFIAGGTISSDCAGYSKVLANEVCKRMNFEHQQAAARIAQDREFNRLAADDRPIPKGFYTDRDAA